jgi:alkanesulfonate monooxygenase SsuD/methylene tetrahydromethanopterin reductase-like flavin-dependent oxidoreductase (luciferase family)
MQVGIDSFAAALDENSRAVNPADRLRQIVEQIEHADEMGLDAFGVGEHRRREFLDSAPAVILGAAAARTQRIRLTSAVTVLSAEDPVRAFQNFATIDLLSRGRAEMIVGRGSSLEAFASLPQVKMMRAIDAIGARIEPALHQADTVNYARASARYKLSA